jgi:hypothetical protein
MPHPAPLCSQSPAPAPATLRCAALVPHTRIPLLPSHPRSFRFQRPSRERRTHLIPTKDVPHRTSASQSQATLRSHAYSSPSDRLFPLNRSKLRHELLPHTLSLRLCSKFMRQQVIASMALAPPSPPLNDKRSRIRAEFAGATTLIVSLAPCIHALLAHQLLRVPLGRLAIIEPDPTRAHVLYVEPDLAPLDGQRSRAVCGA